jgi:hypothetical protein
VEGAEPHIDLLRDRRVEVVPTILIQQLWVSLHVAVLATQSVTCLMLRPVMERINAHADAIEEFDLTACDFTEGIAVGVVD